MKYETETIKKVKHWLWEDQWNWWVSVKFMRKKRENTNTEIWSEKVDITTDSTVNKRIISMTRMNTVISINLTDQIKWEIPWKTEITKTYSRKTI